MLMKCCRNFATIYRKRKKIWRFADLLPNNKTCFRNFRNRAFSFINLSNPLFRSPHSFPRCVRTLHPASSGACRSLSRALLRRRRPRGSPIRVCRRQSPRDRSRWLRNFQFCILFFCTILASQIRCDLKAGVTRKPLTSRL